MRIAEISSPDHRNKPEPDHQLQHLLSQINSLINQTETLSSTRSIPETIPTDLRQTLTNFSQLLPFPNSVKLQIWKLSYRLWNACVDISNSLSTRSSSSVAKLRHVAADMLALAIDVVGVPSPATKSVSFYYKTGLAWHGLGVYDLASTCFERATEVAGRINVNEIVDSDERKLLLELNLARSRTAWELSDRNLTVTLLSRSKSLLFSDPEHYKALANQYLTFGTGLLSKNEGSGLIEALKLMNEALDLLEKGSAAARTREHSVDLKELKCKTLRFISAVHLQKKEYESVIKCIKVLREGNGNTGDDHASLPVMAMKAWLGLRRYGEAEKELKGMVTNKGVPESVWVSSVEDYFEAAGIAGAETAKGVFLGLLGRCHVSAKAAVRVARRVVGYGVDGSSEGSRVRGKVVGELVSDDRVVALLLSDANVKERMAMHAVLWNCAADHFRSKDYEMSAEIFEKSLLYVPHDLESRILRAKGYRVLSLCYLGLSQLDRAQEYVNEAEKLEPNIVCAFLKFKIYLQKDDQSAAINQIQAMRSCLDFLPDFLTLSAHEAIACHALPVAAASLSDLLNFYSTGKSIPVPEVVVLRTLISILSQDPEKKTEILKHMKWSHSRATELGTDCFFGEGEIGRREKNWFAINSWNFGTKCAKEKNYELCAEFLRLVSIFFCDQFGGIVEEDNNVIVCKSLILTVTSMIASEEKRKFTLTDTEVKQAFELLQKAEKMINSLSAETHEDKISKIDPELLFMYTFNAYSIYERLDHLGPQQLMLVKRYASSKACKPKHLLQLGLHASQGTRSNHEVATYALNECLSALLSSPSPDYQEIALILRRLIAVASIHKGDSDDDVVYMYKQAYRIMVGLKEGSYPTEEGKWLAMTAWNRAALPVRMRQTELAMKWMNVGLELATKVAGMETYKSCMEDFLAAFRDKIRSPKNQ